MKILIILLLFSFSLNAQQAKKIYASSTFASGPAYDNSAKLKILINNAPNKSTIIFPNGDYYFSVADTIFNKAITLQGAENTNLYFKKGGLVITRTYNPGTCQISDINFFGIGERQFNLNNGLEIHSITNLRNVFIKNFGGTGLSMTADVGSNKTDVSRSIVENVRVQECGQGFYTQGGDANGISFYSCDARDCDTYGFNDDSFLGDGFYSCMAHANKLGGYRALGGTVDGGSNNRTLFMGCYNEGGQPESLIGGVTYVFGGICGEGAGWKSMNQNVKIFQQ